MLKKKLVLLFLPEKKKPTTLVTSIGLLQTTRFQKEEAEVERMASHACAL